MNYPAGTAQHTGNIATVDVIQAAESSSGPGNWLVILLFAVSGLLVGGAWSAHQSGSRLLAIICALLAIVAFIAAVAWLIGGMT